MQFSVYRIAQFHAFQLVQNAADWLLYKEKIAHRSCFSWTALAVCEVSNKWVSQQIFFLSVGHQLIILTTSLSAPYLTES